MATFELIGDATYRVEGEITQEDVARINAFKIRTNLILSNTRGQSSEIIGQITTDNAYFSVLGGLDYFEKEKYNNNEYIPRTQTAPKGLKKVLQYFERVEDGIKPEWTDTQKCMYAYNALVEDIEYVKEFDDGILESGTVPRSLNGVLYNKLTCAGIALTFKEMMDRLGIECHYQNQVSKHDFNVVKLDGKYRGIDATWDCDSKDKHNGKCSFNNFGMDPDFYTRDGHLIQRDSAETVFDLTTFSTEELIANYNEIKSAINDRRKIIHPFINFDKDKRRTFLPVDRFKEELEEEGRNITKLKILKQLGAIPAEIEGMLDATKGRYGFVSDYVRERKGSVGETAVLEEIKQKNGLQGHLRIDNNQLLFKHQTQDGTSIVDEPLTEQQCMEITPGLLEDITQYYTQYFNDGAAHIDEMIETLSMIDSMPPEIALKSATLKAHLFTKIQMFAKGDDFFKKIGIPSEQIDVVSEKAKGYFDKLRDEHEGEATDTKHQNDLDFLYAIIQNDIIDTIATGAEYTEDNLAKLISDVRTNWNDAEFSDEDFRKLLDEALDKTMNPKQITESTRNAGMGLQDANAIATEIRRSQTLDLQQSQDQTK